MSYPLRRNFRYAFSQPNRMSSRHRVSRWARRAYAPRNFGTTYPNALYKTTMPPQQKVCLKYTAYQSLSSGASTAASQSYKLNSIFDPDHTGTGHQPQGHDQWALLYTHYRVDKVTFEVNAEVGSGSGFLTLFSSNDGASITDPATGPESPGAITVGVQGGGGARKLFKSFNICNVAGVTRSTLDNDDLYRATMAADPQAIYYGRLAWVDATLSGSIVCNVAVNIKYYCTLYGPNQQATS